MEVLVDKLFMIDNRGAIMEIDVNLKCSFHILEPSYGKNNLADTVASDSLEDTTNEEFELDLAKDVFVAQIPIAEEDSVESVPDTPNSAKDVFVAQIPIAEGDTVESVPDTPNSAKDVFVAQIPIAEGDTVESKPGVPDSAKDVLVPQTPIVEKVCVESIPDASNPET